MVLFCKSDLALKINSDRCDKKEEHVQQENCINWCFLFPQAMSANMLKEKFLPYIKLVSPPPKVNTLKLILYQFPGFRHYNSPGTPWDENSESIESSLSPRAKLWP